MKKLMLENLKGNPTDTVPLWLMRQAGRYLPEYHETRKQAGSFLNLCYNPKLAAEVTLQPIRRFDFDASIVFADILVIPDALGQDVTFKDGIGPVLCPVQTLDEMKKLSDNMDKIHNHLNPIYETLDILKTKLPKSTTLIGFAGSPWTVSTYMIMGKGKQNYNTIIDFCNNNAEFYSLLLETLIESTAQYLIQQVKAGAEVLQLFDSWAGALPYAEFQKWCIEPNRKIIEKVKAVYPDIPIIGFPRGSGQFIPEFITSTKCDGISVEQDIDLKFAKESIQSICPIQGCLSPDTLITGHNLEQEVYTILENFKDKPHIFNLGHGINKETPIENVEKLVSLVKNFKK